MSDIDDSADALSNVKTGEGFGSVPIVGVGAGSDAVTVVVELPSGDQFTETFNRPPVWGSNCRLKRLLDAFDLGPDEAKALEGETVPCKREVNGGSLDFSVDLDALERQRREE